MPAHLPVALGFLGLGVAAGALLHGRAQALGIGAAVAGELALGAIAGRDQVRSWNDQGAFVASDKWPGFVASGAAVGVVGGVAAFLMAPGAAAAEASTLSRIGRGARFGAAAALGAFAARSVGLAVGSTYEHGNS